MSRIAVGACGALIISSARANTGACAGSARRVAFGHTAHGDNHDARLCRPGPADPNLRVVVCPGGKKIHLLPATLETTQWGWFDNSQPPVLRVHSGDTIVLETMMHSHNQVVPGVTIEQ